MQQAYEEEFEKTKKLTRELAKAKKAQNPNWGHVGSQKHLNQLLEEALRVFRETSQ